MSQNILESLSVAKYPLPRSGTYKVSPTIDHEGIAIIAACGSNLSNAEIFTFTKSRSVPRSFTVRDKRDGNRNLIPQHIWLFTWLKPVKEGNLITFGKGIGENNKDIARVEQQVGSFPQATSADAIGPIPNRALIPMNYHTNILHPGTDQELVSVNVVHDNVPEHGTIQDHAIVLMVDNIGETPEIKAWWNGKDNHKNARILNKRDAAQLSFCALIKSNQMESDGSGARFKFEVGDPRREAIVTVQEEV